MKTVNVSVFAIGVALCVAPFFNSARAQSTSNSAAVLLELQTLRSEIAELRDMVERQQFELKKLKQANSRQPRPQGVANGFPQGGVTSGQPYVSQGSAEYPAQALPQGGLPQGGQIPPQQYPSSTDITAEANSGVAPNTQVLNNGVEVVDRSLDLPVGQVSGPEVVERSVGSDQAVNRYDQGSTFPSTQPQAAPQADPRYTASNVPQTQSTGNRPVVSIPNANAPQGGGWGVINAAEPLPTATSQPQASIESSAQFTEDQYYDRGFEFLKKSQYDEAVNVFKQQLADHPQGDLADDAHYWIAEAMFINRKPVEARPHLRAIIDNYPQSARLPDAMLKSAYIEQDLGNLIEARILLQEVVARHPSSNAAIAAKNRLENLKSAN